MSEDPIIGWMCAGTVCLIVVLAGVTIAICVIRDNWNGK